MEDAPTFLKIPKVRMSGYLDTSTKTQMAEIIIQYGRSSRSSWAKSVRSSSGRTIMEMQFEKSSIGTRLGEISKLGCIFVNNEKGIILICVRGRCKTGWKETKHWSNVESTDETSRFGRTNIISWPRLLGCTPRECETSKDIVDNYKNMFESRTSAGATEKLLGLEKLDANISTCSYDLEGHAKKCVERYCDLANKTNQRKYEVSTPGLDDREFKEEGICGIIVKSVLSNRPDTIVFGTHW